MEKNSEDYLKFIKSRASIRNFVYEKIDKTLINKCLECARWAPSGLNNQPWKVCVVEHPTVKRMIAETSKYGGIIEDAYYNLVIFLDLEKGYDRVKDIQGIGAFMQNILLCIHAFGLGAVWIGEILNNKEEVNKIFKMDPDKYELMGIIAVGVIDEAQESKNKKERSRIAVENFTEWY